MTSSLNVVQRIQILETHRKNTMRWANERKKELIQAAMSFAEVNGRLEEIDLELQELKQSEKASD